MNISGPPIGGPAGAPGAGPSGHVDKMMEIDRQEIQNAETRKERDVAQKNEYGELDTILGELSSATTGLRQQSDFRKMKVDSSHPDLVEGEIKGPVRPGNYSLEVDQLAKSSQHADIGLASKEEEVGFGYLAVEGADGKAHDIVIEPGSNLQDVANKINESKAGVQASILDTGIGEEPYRLIVKSSKTGESSAVSLDPDTTFLEFDQTRPGQNLSARVDDIEVAREANSADDLIDGLGLNFKKALPGEKINISVESDLDATIEQIKGLTSGYNKVVQFAKPGKDAGQSIANDSSVRGVVRDLQSKIGSTRGSGKFGSLAEVGVTTNAKTGELQVDETKLKKALSEDFDSVSSLFADSESGPGVASRIADTVRNLNDPQYGVLSNRKKSMNKKIQQQEEMLVKKQERFETKQQKLTETFAKINNSIAAANQQSQTFAAQLGSM